MARYPDSLIDLIRERIDLLELVGRRVALKKQGTAWLGLCPFHNEKTPSFSVRPDKGYKCFGCGAGGDAFKFLMQTKGIGFAEAVEELAAMSGVPLPRDAHAEDPEMVRRAEHRRQILALLAEVREFYQKSLSAPGGQRARHYLTQRGLKPETVQQEKLGYAPAGWNALLDRFGGGEAAVELLEAAGLVTRKAAGERPYDRFRDRIVFPIHDLKGHCVGFGGRLMGPGEPKYLNSPETDVFQKGKLLYGLETAREAIRKEGSVLVVEGYMDRLSLVDQGVLPVVATLGTAMTPDHLRLLWQQTRKIHFCFDGDAAGEKAAWKALEMFFDGLESDHHAAFLFLPPGEDPDQVVRREGAAGFARRISGGIAPIDFLIRRLGEGLNGTEPEGRAALMHRAKPLLAKVKDPLLRELYLQTLGQRLQIPHAFAPVSPRVDDPAPYVAPRPTRRSQPLRPVVAGRTLAAAQRNHEQALLALILRHPRLMREREEELSRLPLENAQLSALLTELIERARASDDPIGHGTTEWFSSPELTRCAQEVLAAEEVSPELVDQEFAGCLISVHVKSLRRERMQLMRRIDLEGDGDHALTIRCRALKLEEQRVLGQKIIRDEGR
ncbi:MAG: DNA primase [Magnetococcales bacterium]|nr:DNA primase [Magnetococcales bacterium]